ncbi:hypothetical protein H8B09_06915 [Paenibacillus sp. PR3]|uniref:Competence protein J (ComJ) n=1 Tax=Paenibacillus terricola TaxID=2763503 RepID=A0ABR8MUA6_9BACL|nr:competence protein ComJ [Paenibacillus terricola]MBD3918480.1 hypothetical protein [Paenibacillus terricola]
MEIAEFRLGILYTTIAVILPHEDFNDWNETHYNQGFAWRATSVSFGTLTDEPECKVVVKISDTIELNENASRIIRLPFEVGTSGIEIASIADRKGVNLHEGTYQLIFSAIPGDNNSLDTYEFVFIQSDAPRAEIIKADDQLSPPVELLMEAKPAV